MTAISAGWGKEDDCVMVRLYLPRRPDLVTQQANVTIHARPLAPAVDAIKDLMVGVHLAAMTEAMSFCEYLCIDTGLMFDIVSSAAGASAIFLETFADMQKGAWKLRSITDVEKIEARLVSTVH